MANQPPLTRLLARGPVCTVECIVRENGNCPTEDFLAELAERYVGKKEKNITAAGKFEVLFQEMANHGVIAKKRFKHQFDDFCSFRHEIRRVQIRFPCFQDGNRWIVTHGFDKPGGKKGLGEWPKNQIERTKDLKKVYQSRKAAQSS